MRMSLDESLASCDPAMESRLLELVRFILRRGDRALARFASLWREFGHELADVVDATTNATPPKTGHDPAGSIEIPPLEDDSQGATSAA